MTAFADLVARDSLCVVSTTRADGSIQSSLVNAGVMGHPTGSGDVVAFVVAGNALKLRLLRARPQCAVVARDGFEWAATEGTVELVGPDDPYPDVDPERLRLLLREVFIAAGGTHDDWDEYDRTMAEERRTVVLVSPTRTYGITR